MAQHGRPSSPSAPHLPFHLALPIYLCMHIPTTLYIRVHLYSFYLCSPPCPSLVCLLVDWPTGDLEWDKVKFVRGTRFLPFADSSHGKVMIPPGVGYF